ncbi:DUF6079 family protein [candidate division CSSED10-310 bacterium]|uniref:DUF6079 family protein n=1 Tax=candidate division CSSED10-310 bacterium TaxID=2855610 RepID=A0ABV6YXG2_UNCC1
MAENTTLGHLISAPDVRTVVQLRDLEDQKLSQALARHFVFTAEVCFIFNTILEKVSYNQGQGFFLMGNYGSGKSHLLFTLSLIFDYPQLRQHLNIRHDAVASLIEEISQKKYLLVTVPLQEHSNHESLEQAILFHISRQMASKFGEELPVGLPSEAYKIIKTSYRAEFEKFLKKYGKTVATLEEEQAGFLAESFVAEKNLPFKSHYSRHLFIPRLKEFLQRQGCAGVVVLIDEISEFLRSKLQPRTFQEDIRFVQFLGEGSNQIPLWIVASLQERIEETGEIPQATFHKIKDRYPIRLSLSGQHIQELIHRFLIVKRPGSETQISDIHQELGHHFGPLPFSQESFSRLYPVHPTTIQYLEELRPLFSQHRGVVDFIHYNIVGDPARRIRGHLDAPREWLLTPDLIFDHFRLRIKETIEWNRYHDIVFHYFQEQVEHLFSTETERELALRIIKLLILSCLFPTPRALTVAEMTLMLLHRVTDLDPQVNYQYIQAVADKLVQEGVYLVRRKDDRADVDRYTIDIEYDLKIVVERKLDVIRQEIFPDDQRLFTILGQDLREPFLPLAQFQMSEINPHEVTWLNSKRLGFLALVSVRDQKEGWLQEVKRFLLQKEEHFFFLIFSPLQPEQDIDEINQFLLADLPDHAPQLLMWLPQKIEKNASLTDILARRILMQRLEREQNIHNNKIREYLEEMINQDRLVVKETFRTCYLDGEIIDGHGQVLYALRDLGLLPFPELLSKVLGEFFKLLYPKHHRIAALTEVYQRNRLDELIQKFFMPGQIDFQHQSNFVLKSIIDGYLKPMKLTKQIRKDTLLDCDPNRSEVVRAGLKLMKNQSLNRQDWEKLMKKCEFGLSNPQIELLLLAMIFSGNMTAFSRDKKITPDTMTVKTLAKIDRVGPGEIISPEHQSLLFQLNILPEQLIFKGFFSIIVQQEIWQWLVEFKESMLLKIENLNARMLAINQDPLFTKVDLEKALLTVSNLKKMVDSICITFDSRKGLLRFLDFVRNNPFIPQQLGNFDALATYFGDEFMAWKKRLHYLQEFQKNRFLSLAAARYQQVTDIFSQLQNEMYHATTLVDADFQRTFGTRFQNFQTEYQQLYLQEHNHYHSPLSLKPYEIIVQSKHLKVLNLLARLEGVQSYDQSRTWLKKIQEGKDSLCQHPVTEIIQEKLWCDCGFQIGDTRPPLAVNEILQNFEDSIRQTLTNIKQARVTDLINPQLSQLEEIGKGENALRIQELLTIAPDETRVITKLAQILNPDMVNTFNKILKGKVTFQTKNIQEFLDQVAGKSLPVSGLVKLFSDWLAVEQEDIYVRLEYDRTRTEAPSPLHHFLTAAASPELRSLLDALGEQQFTRMMLFLLWLQERMCPLEKIYSLCPDLPAHYKELLPSAARLSQDLFTQYPHLIEEHDRLIYYQEDPQIWLHRCLDALAPMTVPTLLKNEKMFTFLIQAGIKEIITAAIRQELELTPALINDLKQSALIKSPDPVPEEIEALSHIRNYLLSKHQIKAASFETPLSPQDWENVFRHDLALLPYRAAQARKILHDQDLADFLGVLQTEKIDQFMVEINQSFTDFYERSHHTIGMKLEAFLNHKIPAVQKKYPRSQLTYLLLDGLRYDLWLLIIRDIFAREGTIPQPFEELFLWASLPTNTGQQLKTLSTDGPYSFLNVTSDERASQKLKQEFEFTGGTIYKINVIDSKIHTSHDSLPILYKEIITQLQRQVVPLIRGLGAGDIMVVFADHGFTENPAFSEADKYNQSRYIHGGCSLHEVLVPAAFFYKM